MNLLLRLLWQRLVGRFQPRVEITGPVWTPFRVLPTDLDVQLHMNNGVYLSLLDIARMDLLQRADLLKPLRKRGWFPVVTAESIGFRRSLTLFQRFEVGTQVLGWDDRSFYVHQRFVRNGEVVAAALVIGRFLSRDGESVPATDVAALGGFHESPTVPEWALRLGRDQKPLRQDAVD